MNGGTVLLLGVAKTQTSKTQPSDPEKLRPTWWCIGNSDHGILLIRDKRVAQEAIAECATDVLTTF